MHAMTRTSSDHTPLLIDSRDQAHLGNKPHFSFELSWFRQSDFYEVVSREWSNCVSNGSPIEQWQNKIRHLRQFLKGWAKNKCGEYKKQK